MSLASYISQIKIFLKYRYKTMYDNRISGVDKPYIPKSERSEHDYALDKIEWAAIISRYLDLVLNEILIKGKTFRMPARLGLLQLVKFKGGGIDHIKTKRLHNEGKLLKGEVARYNNIHTNGYGVKLKWYRTSHAKFINKYFYRVALTKGTKKYISSYFKENPKEVYKLSDL